MSKADMMAKLVGNLDESIGATRRPGAPAGPVPRSLPADMVGRQRAKDTWAIEIDRITPDPDQPRKEFDEDALTRLAESLRTRGQLQPIQVRWDAKAERFVILMGERRWRAAHMAGLATMSCVVREGAIGDGEKLSIQLIENALREDLSAVEQAKAFRTLMDREGWNQEKLAAELAVTTASVARALSLLRLPDEVQDRVEQGGLSPSHAYEIAKLDDPREQVRLAEAAADQGLTRDDVAKVVRRSNPGTKKKAVARKLPPAMVWRLSGCRLEVARKSGVDLALAEAVLREALSKVVAMREEEAGREAA